MPAGYPITEAQKRKILRLRSRGLSGTAVGERLGIHATTVCSHSRGIGRGYSDDKVPVAPLREAFLSSGQTCSQVAYRLGWEREHRPGRFTAETSRLQRALGLRLDTGQKSRSPRMMIGRDLAERIADAIGVASWEVMP